MIPFPEQIAVFMLIMIRTGSVVFSAPVFGSSSIPNLVKAATTAMISLALFPLIGLPEGWMIQTVGGFVLIAVKETIVGLIIGFIVSMFMNAFFISGQIIDTQMGLGVTNVIDPLLKTNIPILGQIHFLIAVLIFLAINGPYYMIQALLWSYETLPLTELALPSSYGAGLIRISVDMWLIAFKIGGPIIVTLALTMIGIGMVAKTVPQMNIFIVGFPVTISVGLVSFYATMFWFQPLTEGFFAALFDQIGFFLKS